MEAGYPNPLVGAPLGSADDAGGGPALVSSAGPINPNPLSDVDLAKLEEAKRNLSSCTDVIFDFLQSKGLFAAEKALRTELALNYEREISYRRVISRNLWQSNLERLLDIKLPRGSEEGEGEEGEMVVMLSQLGQIPGPSGATPTNWGGHAAHDHTQAANTSSRSTPSRRLGVRLHQLHPSMGEEESHHLRKQRARLAQQSCVVFREGKPMDEAQRASVEMLALPMLYNPHIRGLEDSPELDLSEGVMIAGRYRVQQLIGKGSFSRVVQCYDQKENRAVSVKVLHNDKDCVDQGIGEIRLLSLLREKDTRAEVPLVQLLDYFYFREHLLIVTELLRDSIFNFYRYLRDTSPEGHGAYFTLDTLRTLATQLCSALAFMHKYDMVHCDLKPENVCIASASRRRFKIIDVGSAVLGHDVHFSYVQTRGYRAPEVMLGLPWGEKVDMWGVGCILAELVLGQQLFHGPSVEHVLAAQQAVLGPLPKHMIAASATRNLYFTPSGHLYTIDPPSHPPGAYRLMPVETDLLNLLDVDDDDFLDFLSHLLALDPDRRLTATEALAHPWLNPDMVDISSSVEAMSVAEAMEEEDDEPTPPAPQNLNKRRGSGDGPSVPSIFREAAQAESSRSHEWRQRLMRLVVGTGRSTQGSPKQLHPSDGAALPDEPELTGSANLGMDTSGSKPYVP